MLHEIQKIPISKKQKSIAIPNASATFSMLFRVRVVFVVSSLLDLFRLATTPKTTAIPKTSGRILSPASNLSDTAPSLKSTLIARTKRLTKHPNIIEIGHFLKFILRLPAAPLGGGADGGRGAARRKGN